MVPQLLLLREISKTCTISAMHERNGDDHRYDEFMDSFGHYMETQRGMPLAGGRVFAYLLVCEPPEQTAAQIAEAVGMSLGTVSSMTRLLLNGRLIERVRRRGERSGVYRFSPAAMGAMTRASIAATTQAREIVDLGLSLMADRPTSAKTRLAELGELYRFFESSMPALLESWEKARREGTA